MCRPTHYCVRYQINPWMDLGRQPDARKAAEQWGTLCDLIQEHGGAIRYVKDQPGLPDMVFTANAGLVMAPKLVLLSNFRHPERKGEEEWFVQWFAEDGWSVIYPDVPFEGAGDVLSMESALYCGHGFRSDASVYDSITGAKGVVPLRLVDPRFYHLDTCFCPLAGGDYLIYPPAIDANDLQFVKGNGIVVPEAEAVRFACNAVTLGRTVLLPADCPETAGLLASAGYEPVAVPMSEFIKAGGACKCLTLEIG